MTTGQAQTVLRNELVVHAPQRVSLGVERADMQRLHAEPLCQETEANVMGARHALGAGFLDGGVEHRSIRPHEVLRIGDLHRADHAPSAPVRIQGRLEVRLLDHRHGSALPSAPASLSISEIVEEASPILRFDSAKHNPLSPTG